jgi:hypothetical protein
MFILLKSLATIAAIAAHILANAAAMETYYFLVLGQNVRYRPDGLFLIALLVPAFIAIWSKNGTLGRRFLAWTVGLTGLIGTVVIIRLVVAGVVHVGGVGWWLIVIGAMPALLGVAVGAFATITTLRSSRPQN